MSFQNDIIPSLIFPWMSKGNIRDMIKQSNKDLEDKLHAWVSLIYYGLVFWLTLSKLSQVTHGLEYLHSNNNAHGDLRGVSATVISNFYR